ncbi:MAG TPA: hypothetical protein PLK94_08170 [Alphaproteobacteria bacterium]|nr:hypothetical protein [Alphaproteobacteria bacterium]
MKRTPFEEFMDAVHKPVHVNPPIPHQLLQDTLDATMSVISKALRASPDNRILLDLSSLRKEYIGNDPRKILAHRPLSQYLFEDQSTELRKAANIMAECITLCCAKHRETSMSPCLDYTFYQAERMRIRDTMNLILDGYSPEQAAGVIYRKLLMECQMDQTSPNHKLG